MRKQEKQEVRVQRLKLSVTIALIGAFVALLICTLVLCNGFWRWTPLWLGAVCIMICVLLDVIPSIRNRNRLKLVIQIASVAISIIILLKM